MEDRLKKFARLNELGSFTRAAQDLHTSQPALSAAIIKLERELGAQLLSRRKPPIKLTEAGDTAYQYAKQLEVTTSNLKTELSELGSKKLSLSIGMIDSMADALFVNAQYLPDLREQANISLTVDNSRILIRAVERGELDIALITKPNSIMPSLSSTQLGKEPLIAVTSPLNAKKISSDLNNRGRIQNFLSYDRSSNTDRTIRSYFASKNIQLKTTFSSTSPEILLHLIQSGEGVAVLPYLMVQPAINGGSLVPVGNPIMRPINSIEPKGKVSHATLNSLKGKLKEVLTSLNQQANQIIDN